MRTAFLKKLPPPAELRQRLRALTIVDTVVAPDLRQFEFHPRWSKGEQMGAFKDGEGSDIFVWFAPGGVVIKGFCDWLPRRRVATSSLPRELRAFLKEPAFTVEDISFLIWFGAAEEWTAVAVTLDAEAYRWANFLVTDKLGRWLDESYGERLAKKPLGELLAGGKIDKATVAALTEEPDWKEIRKEAKLLGWPCV
jgi:hypothetical protein